MPSDIASKFACVNFLGFSERVTTECGEYSSLQVPNILSTSIHLSQAERDAISICSDFKETLVLQETKFMNSDLDAHHSGGLVEATWHCTWNLTLAHI